MPSALRRHTPGSRPRGHSARLEHHDLSTAGNASGEQSGWHPGCFAGAGRSTQHQRPAGGKRGGNPWKYGVYGERLRTFHRDQDT